VTEERLPGSENEFLRLTEEVINETAVKGGVL